MMQRQPIFPLTRIKPLVVITVLWKETIPAGSALGKNDQECLQISTAFILVLEM
ncbi:hypothetical protein [Bartonella tribocorum]|uniref:hypothetical protein n=1 Tax=Bartonella tribocorum TaxID=85701 RepID=UPI0015D52A52|nr:hypothetical protein [Bartonella tribocorum]